MILNVVLFTKIDYIFSTSIIKLFVILILRYNLIVMQSTKYNLICQACCISPVATERLLAFTVASIYNFRFVASLQLRINNYELRMNVSLRDEF